MPWHTVCRIYGDKKVLCIKYCDISDDYNIIMKNAIKRHKTDELITKFAIAMLSSIIGCESKDISLNFKDDAIFILHKKIIFEYLIESKRIYQVYMKTKTKKTIIDMPIELSHQLRRKLYTNPKNINFLEYGIELN